MNIIVHSLLFSDLDIIVIDATNDFDVLRLHTVLRANVDRLRAEAVTGPGTECSPVIRSMSDDDLIRMLDRVKVMRAFDLTGVVEAVSEIRVGQIASSNPMAQQSAADVHSEDNEEETTPQQPLERDSSHTAKDLPTSANIKVDVGLVIFQGFDRIASPLIKRDYVQGHAFTTSLLRSISHLARSINACTVLTNSASAPRSSLSKPNRQGQGEQSAGTLKPVSHPSIFSSCHLTPLHHKLLDTHVDLHLMLSKLPRSGVDAQICYNSDVGQGSTRYKSANVVEVLLDKAGTKTGRWFAFDITSQETLKPM